MNIENKIMVWLHFPRKSVRMERKLNFQPFAVDLRTRIPGVPGITRPRLSQVNHVFVRIRISLRALCELGAV